jgi:hypothetical protein
MVQQGKTNEMVQFCWLKTLIGPKALDEGPKWEIGKLKLKLHGIVLEGKSIGLDQKTRAKRKASSLKNQDGSLRYNPNQGFNLLQMNSSWFLGNWTLV